MEIIKHCKFHGQLTINDVYIRNTRKGIDCKWCSKDSARKRRLANPELYKELGRKFRYLQRPENITSLRCCGCKKELEIDKFTENSKNKRHPYCSECRSKVNYKSKIRNRSTYDKYKLRASEASRKCYLKKQYNLTIAQFNQMLIKQNYECAICNDIPKILHIDHNHETGKIRELLCGKCNRGIGFLKDSPILLKKAIDYLNRHSN